MDNMSPNDPGVYERWLRESEERFAFLLKSGRFVAKDPDWVPVRLAALATGYVREVSGPRGRPAHMEIRLELLENEVRDKAQVMYGSAVEWLSVQQISAISGLSTRTVTSQYEELAASLFTKDPLCSIVNGRVMVSTEILSPKGKERLAEAVKEGKIKPISIPGRKRG